MINTTMGQLSCHRCHLTQEVPAATIQVADVGQYGWWAATEFAGQGWPAELPRPAGRVVRLFCPPCAGIVDGARQVLREALGQFQDVIGYVFHGPPPRLPHTVGLLPGYLVVRKRDDAPAEVIPFAEEAPAREAYGYLHENWTETYLCAVISGPGLRLPTLFDGMAAIAAEQRMQRSSGYTSEHDAEHFGGELALAAAHYAAPRPLFRPGIGGSMRSCYPFGNKDKRAEWPRVRQLAVAGAFCASEINRLRSAHGLPPDIVKLNELIARFKGEEPEGREKLLASLAPSDRWKVDPGLQGGDWLHVPGFASSVVVLANDASGASMAIFGGDDVVEIVESDAPLIWLLNRGSAEIIRELATRERFLAGVRAAIDLAKWSVDGELLRLVSRSVVRVAGGSEVDMARIEVTRGFGGIKIRGPLRFSAQVLEAVHICVQANEQVFFLGAKPAPTPVPGSGKAHCGP